MSSWCLKFKKKKPLQIEMIHTHSLAKEFGSSAAVTREIGISGV